MKRSCERTVCVCVRVCVCVSVVRGVCPPPRMRPCGLESISPCSASAHVRAVNPIADADAIDSSLTIHQLGPPHASLTKTRVFLCVVLFSFSTITGIIPFAQAER